MPGVDGVLLAAVVVLAGLSIESWSRVGIDAPERPVTGDAQRYVDSPPAGPRPLAAGAGWLAYLHADELVAQLEHGSVLPQSGAAAAGVRCRAWSREANGALALESLPVRSSLADIRVHEGTTLRWRDGYLAMPYEVASLLCWASQPIFLLVIVTKRLDAAA